MTLTVGSLFSGIGGLDLGLERAGMKVIWQSEIDPYCNKVLKKHWPEVTNHGNIKEIDWTTVERPDVICGGYPCQPFSTAGKRRGTDDPRHLWPWVRDAISALRPSYAILENVRGHLSMGGLQVIGELAEIGYDAEWRVVSAAGMGAPHRRERIIIVAYPNNSRDRTSTSRIDRNGSQEIKERKNIAQFGFGGCCENVANSNCGDSTYGGQCTDVQGKDRSRGDDRARSRSDLGQISLGSTGEGARDVANTCEQQFDGRGHQHGAGTIEERQTIQEQADRSSSNVAYPDNCGHVYAQIEKQPDIGRRSKEIGRLQWEVEPDVGRVAHGISARVDRLRGLGNAVVPQVAEYIGHLVMAAHNNS